MRAHVLFVSLILISCSYLVSVDAGKPKTRGNTKRKTAVAAREYNRKRRECDASVTECEYEQYDRDNCVLRCISQPCFQSIYANDPLEDGEVDETRSRAYKKCAKEQFKDVLIPLSKQSKQTNA